MLYPSDPDDGQPALIDETAYTQPALFALEYALNEVWRSWGIQPDVVLGHSIGEYVAACVAGVFSLEDGLRLAAARGRLMQALPRTGTMVAIQSSADQVARLIDGCADRVSIAAVNGPRDVVVSGERAAVEAVAQRARTEGARTRSLTVSHAFHSPLMEPMLADFLEVASEVDFHAPRISLISNVTGEEVGDEVTDPAYWVRHVREAVRFGDGLRAAEALGCEVFLECGPQPVLLGMGRLALTDDRHRWVPSLQRSRSDWQVMLDGLAALYVSGLEPDWVAFDRAYGRQKIELPSYPFERQRYWFPAQNNGLGSGGKERLRPLVDAMVQSPLVRETILTTSLSTARLPYLADHRVFDEVVVPGAAYLSVLASAADVLGWSACRLEDVYFVNPLALSDKQEQEIQTVLTPEPSGGGDPRAGLTFQLISLQGAGAANDSTTHASGGSSGAPPRRQLLNVRPG